MFAPKPIPDREVRYPWKWSRPWRCLALFLTMFLLLAVATPSWGEDPAALEDNPPGISAIPMYGQPKLKRKRQLAMGDSSYVQGVAGLFQGDRRLASMDAWFDGERLRSLGLPNAATSRYNQAWLLDHTNYQPYWGFGRVLLRKMETAQAIRHLEEAWRLSLETDPNVGVEATLATAYSMHAVIVRANSDKESLGYFGLARQHFEDCLRRDPAYGDGWVQWARGLKREGAYAEAWEKVRKARALDTPVPPSFLKELGELAPEPK